MPRMPASSTSVSATQLEASPHRARTTATGSPAPPRPSRGLAVSNSRPMPLASIVSSWRYHAIPSTPTCRDVAAEAAEALHQRHVARRRVPQPVRRRGRAGPRADDEHIGLVDDVDLAGRLGDAAERSSVRVGGRRAHDSCIIAGPAAVGERSLLVHLPFTRPTLGCQLRSLRLPPLLKPSCSFEQGDTYVNPVKRRLVLAGIISMSLVAAACGSDDNSSSATDCGCGRDHGCTGR